MALEAERGGSLFLLVRGGRLRRRSTPTLALTRTVMHLSPTCFHLLEAVESILDKEIRKCHPRAWNEDHITYSWLARLQDEWPNLSSAPHLGIDVSWDAYKMDGSLEEENGDVAFLVDLRFDNGNTLHGVGFLEAKRIYPSCRFDALKWKQLIGLNSNSFNHQLLLYDYDPLPTAFSGFDSVCYFVCQTCGEEEECCCCHGYNEKSAAIVVPSVHAIAYEDKGRRLESIGYRLSEQIVMRYFRGLDLNFDKALVANVLAGIAGGAKYLAVATVAIGNSERGSDIAPSDRVRLRPSENSRYRPLQRAPREEG